MSARADIGAIGLRIRERRMTIGLTQEGLAKKLDVTAQAVSKWETGVGCPDIYVLPDIAHVLGVSVDELLGIRAVKLDETDAAAEAVEPAPDENAERPAFFQEDTDRVFAEAEEWVEANAPEQENPAADVEKQEGDAGETDGWKPDERISGSGRPEKEFESGDPAEPDPQSGREADDKSKNFHFDTGNVKVDVEDLRLEYVAEQVEKKITGIFGDSNFGMDLSRYINSAVRSAINSAKGARRRDTGNHAMHTNTYAADGSEPLRGLDIEVFGSGELVVHEGDSGVWDAKITAPDYMFSRIVCQEVGGILYVKIPSASQFGYNGSSPKVRVAIHTGFTLGESLRLDVRGSTDTKLEPDFERSEVHIAGSGDVEMANAGILVYSVAGSGDLIFADAQDASIRISGSGDAHGSCLSGRTSVRISGSGAFSADAVSGTLEAVTSGSGDFSINEGTLDNLKIRISGSGDFYGPNLEVEDAEIRITGGGDTVLGRVRGKLVQNISKSATVRIRQRG